MSYNPCSDQWFLLRRLFNYNPRPNYGAEGDETISFSVALKLPKKCLPSSPALALLRERGDDGSYCNYLLCLWFNYFHWFGWTSSLPLPYAYSWTNLPKNVAYSAPHPKPGDNGTPNAHNRWFNLFYHVWGHAYIKNHKNNIWLRSQSHLTSHYTWWSVTTLHDSGGVLGQPLDTFFWALTISWSWLLDRVWSGPNSPSPPLPSSQSP